MNLRKMFAIRLAVCLVVLAGMAIAQKAPPAVSKAAEIKSELINKLTKQLKITPEQARGGVGAIFGLMKRRLKPEDFSKLAAAVPQMDDLLKAAPPAKEGSLLASLSSSDVGGNLASVAGSFDALGLSPAMVAKFVPIIQKYLKGKGGSGISGMLAGILK